MTIVLHDLILFGLIVLNIGIFIKTWNTTKQVSLLEELVSAFLDGFVEEFDDGN
jgi:vacuolar-type H+-ATPase subunit I/STV1